MSRPARTEMTLISTLTYPQLLAGHTDFRYGSDSPLSVHLELHFGGLTSLWEISRDLFRDGLSAPAGAFDVRVSTVGPNLFLSLGSPLKGIVRFDVFDVKAYLRATEYVCPFGAEDISADVDAAIGRLLKTGGSR